MNFHHIMDILDFQYTVKREFPPPAHFIMEIESYSQLFAKFDDRYQSGIFETGDYKWCVIPILISI